MKLSSSLLFVLLLSIAGVCFSFPGQPGKRSWLTFDIYHQSRALPLGDALVRFPMNAGFQATHHQKRLGSGKFTGGTTLQAGYAQYDRLFWSMQVGGGLETSWRPASGYYASYILRLDYERLYTGSNNFVLENGRYRQKKDTGRSYLRLTPLDISFGYSPKFLRKTGLVPAIRFAWEVDLPLYGGDEPAVWSYTQFGLAINWMKGGQK